jgi:hypothetical protein
MQTKSVSKNLIYFQKQIKAPHAFQAVFSLDYIEADCFREFTPKIVPVKTLLSQFV